MGCRAPQPRTSSRRDAEPRRHCPRTNGNASCAPSPTGCLTTVERNTQSPVTTERVGRTLVVRMERPAKRNAINAPMTLGLDAALNLLEDDPDLWVGILTGTLEVFSAGTDLATGAGEPTPRGGEYGLARRKRTTPLIAAVEGDAYGGGF